MKGIKTNETNKKFYSKNDYGQKCGKHLFHNVKLLNENHVTYDVAMKAERLNKFSVAVSN